MALHGNPFLGKLKIPAPDLSRIPETPFEGTPIKLDKASPSKPTKEESSPKSDGVQTGSEIGFNGVQTGASYLSATNSNPIEPILNRVQTGSVTGSKPANRPPAFGELAVLRFFADREGVVGSPIYTRRREIAVGTYQTINGVKTALRRLRETGLIQLNSYERGPNRGITSYRLTQKSHEILASKMVIDRLGFNRVQTGSVTGSNGFSSSSSKDLDLNKLTNTGDTEISVDLPSKWNEIDTSPLAAIRFGRSQLVQLARLGILTVEQAQESINAFAFDLEVNGKGREINGHALNYLMGILRRGPYAPAANYESPEIRQMRLYLEAKEREKKASVELETRLEAMEFDEWTTGLTTQERVQLVPPTDFAKPGSPGHNAQLKQYFREKVWSERRESILRDLNQRVAT